MCLAIPMKIININNDRATVELNGVKKDISIKLLPSAKLNEYVIVHAGYAIGVMNEEDAIETLKVANEYGITN